jgi:hypothetical protein
VSISAFLVSCEWVIDLGSASRAHKGSVVLIVPFHFVLYFVLEKTFKN